MYIVLKYCGPSSSDTTCTDGAISETETSVQVISEELGQQYFNTMYIRRPLTDCKSLVQIQIKQSCFPGFFPQTYIVNTHTHTEGFSLRLYSGEHLDYVGCIAIATFCLNILTLTLNFELRVND